MIAIIVVAALAVPLMAYVTYRVSHILDEEEEDAAVVSALSKPNAPTTGSASSRQTGSTAGLSLNRMPKVLSKNVV